MSAVAIATAIVEVISVVQKLQEAYVVAKQTADATPEQLAAADAQVDASHKRLQQAMATGIDPGAGS